MRSAGQVPKVRRAIRQGAVEGAPSRTAGRARSASSRQRSAGSLLITHQGPGPLLRRVASNRWVRLWLVMITS